MPPHLSKERIIERDALREIAESRLAEAAVLLTAKHYSAAVYLAGYAVECYLKYAICVTLDWDALYGMFKVHDLEGLLLYSGLDRALRQDEKVSTSFAKLEALWAIEGRDSIRYRRPSEFDDSSAQTFLNYTNDPLIGVIPWLRKQTS